MSYYQDDNLYHYYSEPAYDEDTSNYSYSILNHDNYSPHPSTTAMTTLWIQSTMPTPPCTMNLRPMQRLHQTGRILTTKYTQPTMTTQATTTIWTCPTPSNHLKMMPTPLILTSITRTRSTQPIATTP